MPFFDKLNMTFLMRWREGGKITSFGSLPEQSRSLILKWLTKEIKGGNNSEVFNMGKTRLALCGWITFPHK